MPLKPSAHIVFVIALLLLSLISYSQEDAQALYEGNDLYNSGKVPEAAAKYARALEMNPNNRKANFNLGDALYKNAMEVKKGGLAMPPGSKMTPDSMANLIFDQAAQNFAVVANSVSDKDTLHRAWHNIGNCYLQKKDYEQAVNAYKKSLKYDPEDEETRYNLAYALKNMPPKKGGGGGGAQNQPQQQKNDQKKDQQQQQQQSQMSKQQAEQLLKALMDQEKKLQDKRKQKAEDPNKNVDKDW